MKHVLKTLLLSVTLHTLSLMPANAAINTFPWTDGFESGSGNWVQVLDNEIFWTVNSGATPTVHTGPTSAYEGANYIYTEITAKKKQVRTAMLISPTFDLSAEDTAQLDFAYHVFGKFIGTLSVEVSTDGGVNWSAAIWSVTDDQGDQWYNAVVDLTPYIGPTVQVRFVSTTGTGVRNDMAIDDVMISNPPGFTQMLPQYSNLTVTNMKDFLYAELLPEATGYGFRLTDQTDGTVYNVYRSGPTYNNFKIFWADGIRYNRTYTLEVQAFGNGVWGAFGNTTTVTVDHPLTQMNANDCNITTPVLNHYLYADWAPYGTAYEFRLTNVSDGVQYTIQKNGETNNYFRLDEISGITYGNTYDVEVRVEYDGVWGAYGSVCQVSVVSPITQLISSQCNYTVNGLGEYLYCENQSLATGYEFQLTDRADGTVLTYVNNGGQYGNYFKLNWVPGIQSGHSYDVSIRVQIGTGWGAYGPVCQLTSSVFKQQDLLEDPVMETLPTPEPTTAFSEITLFPNPVASQLNVRLQSQEEGMIRMQVADMAGRSLQRLEQFAFAGENTFHLNLDHLSNGAYLLVIEQGSYMETRKVMVIH